MLKGLGCDAIGCEETAKVKNIKGLKEVVLHRYLNPKFAAHSSAYKRRREASNNASRIPTKFYRSQVDHSIILLSQP